MAELSLNREETVALDRIEAELQGFRVGAMAATEAAAIDLGDLCKKYRAIRGPLEILVKILRKIPNIGDRVADALEFLMGLADLACPV